MTDRTFHYTWNRPLRSAIEQVWPLISDTQHWNSLTTRLAVKIAQEKSDGVRIIHSKNALVALEWDEYPFEWNKPYHYGVVRKFQRGLLKELVTLCTLAPTPDGGTHVQYEIIARPANFLGSIVIPLQVGRGSRRQFERALKQLDAYLQAPDTQPGLYTSHQQFVTGLGAQRLNEISLELLNDGCTAEYIQRLSDYLNTAVDDEAAHMRAYVLADRWRAPRRVILELFLAATRRSLLDLNWEIVCPWCRGVKATASQLKDVPAKMRCPSCNEEFEINFDHSIEITFKPNASIRRVEVMDYCVGGPQITPHILIQQRLAPAESRTLNAAFEPGVHRVRTRSMRDKPLADHMTFRVSDDQADSPAAHLTVVAQAQGWQADQNVISPQAAVTLENRTDLDQYFVVERVTWNDQATSASELGTVQAFRDWFASQALRPDVRLGIAHLALLFTDLQGSTQLYRQIGDAPAFDRVLEHFEVLREGVNEHHGALVKTIGDSIMAVFHDPVQGVQAGLDILKRIRQLNLIHTDLPYRLKMGMHTGPAIAVTLNERLDYFGSTVNIAARLEGQALGDDLILSSEVMNDLGVQQALKDAGIIALPFKALLKGFVDEEFELYRIRLL